jgi:hypothetical protein
MFFGLHNSAHRLTNITRDKENDKPFNIVKKVRHFGRKVEYIRRLVFVGKTSYNGK